MIIKSIKKYPKKPRSKVIIDNNLHEIENIVIAKYNLYEDMEIEEKEFYSILDESDKEYGYNCALNYLSKYVKSEDQVIKYLKDKKIKHKNIDFIIERLKKNHFINDDKTIDVIIFGLIIANNGRNLIRYKLYNKGFNENLIKEKLDNIDEELYFDTLKEFFKKCEKKYAKYDDFNKKMKIKQYLVQRGYTLSDIEKLKI